MEEKKIMAPVEKRNMWLLIAGLGVSRIGTLAFSFAVGLYILNITGSGMSFAISMVLSALPRVIVSPLAGIVADRYSRKIITVVGDITSGLIVLALLLQSEITVTSLYMVVAGLSIVNTFFDTAITSSIPSLVSDDHLMKLNSSAEVFRSIASICGPMLGGFLFGFGTLKIIVLVNGISFILSGCSEMFINFKYNSKLTKEEQQEKKSYAEVMTFFKKETFFVLMLTMSLSYNFLLTVGINVPHTYLMNNVLLLSPRFIGIIEAILPVGIIAGAVTVSQIKNEKMYLMLCINAVLLGITISLAGLPYLFSTTFSPLFNILYQCFVLFLIGFTLAVINVPIGTKIQQLIPEKLRGRVFSLFGMVGTFLVPFGLILSGGLIQFIDPQIIIVSSGVTIAALSVFFMSFKEFRTLFIEEKEIVLEEKTS